MSEIKPIELEYIYVTIPAEYICVYHRILAMMADFGEDMLKDCKASCTDKNSGVIECFNMFNSAVAAKKLGKDKLAEVIIKYVKAKINQIYKGANNSTSFVFPVDETGQLKAFVSCGERPHFEINADNGELYEHKLNNGFDEHFRLGPEDEPANSKSSIKNDIPEPIQEMLGLNIVLKPRYEEIKGEMRPCADITVTYNGRIINLNYTTYQYYFDDEPVKRFNDVANLSTGVHNFKIVVTYNGQTKIESVDKYYGKIDSDVQPEEPIKPIKNKKKNEMYKTIISTKSIPWYTAREGQIYYTDKIKISTDIFETTDIENISVLEEKISKLIDKPLYGDNTALSVQTNHDSILEVYNFIKENKEGYLYKDADIYIIDNKKRYWYRKTDGTIYRTDYPPYGVLHNDKSLLPDVFPDTLDINNEYEDINQNYVVWLYRKQRVNIIREGRAIIDKIDIANCRLRTWKQWFFRKIFDKNVKPKVIRISRRHHIKYGFAYYRYNAVTNNYIRLKPKFENKTRF